MEDFFKYLTPGEEDKSWGLYLNVAGKSTIAPKTIYPDIHHPSGYFFNWEKGRILDEFQINYITEGSGELETDFGKFLIKPGTLMINWPGIWHRYRPKQKTGWVEHYIGFDGELAKQLLAKDLFSPERPLIYCELREDFIDTYYKIFDLILKEKPGFQQVSSGMIVKLLGYIVAYQKQKQFSGKKIESTIQKATFRMRENIAAEIDLQKLAKEHNMGYSYFRKMFKKYTGVSPHQYHLELKIMRAKELILSSDKSIKEISFELGFQSIYYFSRLFKIKVGTSPSDLRK